LPRPDVESFCRAAAAFSATVVHVADLVREIDINPVRVLDQGCLALDALFVCAPPRPRAEGKARRSA
jgi:hypothetical protein